ncbi:MAG: DMT family transporter [Chloroflexi bacterium]|nr:DMT family transporter [Chloroflexota bacterium]
MSSTRAVRLQGTAALTASLVSINLMWGATPPFTKLALLGFSPFTLAAIRMLVSAVLFGLILLLARRRTEWRVRRSDLPAVAALGVLGITFEIGLSINGFARTSGINSSILISTSPVIIALLSVIRLGERLTLKTIGGVLVAFAGAAVVAGITPWTLSSLLDSSHLIGDLLVLAAAASWALYSVLGKEMMEKYDTLVFAAYSTPAGAIALVPFAIWEYAHGAVPSPSMVSLGALSYIILLVTVLGRIGWFWAIGRGVASRAGMFMFLQPVAGVGLAVLILGERLTASFGLGVALVLGGLYLVTRDGYV